MKKFITVLITSIIILTGCTINKYGNHSKINLEEINDNIYVNYYGSIITTGFEISKEPPLTLTLSTGFTVTI